MTVDTLLWSYVKKGFSTGKLDAPVGCFFKPRGIKSN